MKPGADHASFDVFIFHELFPHKTGTMIFGHEHGDAQIDAKHIGVIPVHERIERVAEPVFRAHLFAVGPADMTQHADAILKEKRERAARGARNDAAIDRANRTSLSIRAAPCRIALNIIGCADAPEILAVIGKAIAE